MTADMSYDEVRVFAEEGQFEPMGSIGSLHDVFTDPREMVDAGPTQRRTELQRPHNVGLGSNGPELPQPVSRQASSPHVPEIEVSQYTSAGAVQPGFHKRRALSLPKSSKHRINQKPPNYHLIPASQKRQPPFHPSASHATADHPSSQTRVRAKAEAVTAHSATGQVRPRLQPSKSKQVSSTAPSVQVASHVQKSGHKASPTYQRLAPRKVEEDRGVQALPPSDQTEDVSTTDYSAQMDQLLQEFQVLTGHVDAGSSTESINESRLI